MANNDAPESRPDPADVTDDGGEDKEDDGTEGSQENLNVLHLLYTIAQVACCDDRTDCRIKRIKMALCTEGSHATNVTRNLFGGFDIIA